MIVINNVSQESENKTTASIHFINLFAFYTKIKTSIYSGLALKNQPNETLSQVSFLRFF